MYNFDGKEYLIVGGAHSIDKIKCLEDGLPFWEDEMPSDETKSLAKRNLALKDNKIYGILTHTCPIKYLPTEMFLSSRKIYEIPDDEKSYKPDIDRSTEQWLDTIEDTVEYKIWFCGHYHIDKEIDNVIMMNHKIRPLHTEIEK